MDNFAWGHYKDSARQEGFGATRAEAEKCRKYHDLQSNTFTYMQLRPLVCRANPPPILSGLVKKFADMSGNTREHYMPVPGCGQRKRCQHIGLCASFIRYHQFFF